MDDGDDGRGASVVSGGGCAEDGFGGYAEKDRGRWAGIEWVLYMLVLLLYR